MTKSFVITGPNQVTADWLTTVLTRSGALQNGAVAHFEATGGGGHWSSNAQLQLTYTDDATGSRPTALFLKMCEGAGFIGQSEVDYYTRDYIGLADAPLVPCYDAQYAPATGRYHILMDDLSATHGPTWEVPPTLAHGFALAAALASLHAYRWTPEQRAEIGAAMHDVAHVERYVDVARAGLEPMLDDVRGDIDPLWETRLHAIFAQHPRQMIERMQNPVGFTVIHGDVNRGNILAPISGQGKVYIVDRQPFDWSLLVWLAVHDLTYMMVTYWPTESRRELEMAVLQEYHRQLMLRGVHDYSWEQLLADYRLCVIQGFYVPTEWCGSEKTLHEMKWVWWRELRYTMAAFDDWHGEELLG